MGNSRLQFGSLSTIFISRMFFPNASAHLWSCACMVKTVRDQFPNGSYIRCRNKQRSREGIRQDLANRDISLRQGSCNMELKVWCWKSPRLGKNVEIFKNQSDIWNICIITKNKDENFKSTLQSRSKIEISCCEWSCGIYQDSDLENQLPASNFRSLSISVNPGLMYIDEASLQKHIS